MMRLLLAMLVQRAPRRSLIILESLRVFRDLTPLAGLSRDANNSVAINLIKTPQTFQECGVLSEDYRVDTLAKGHFMI